VIPLWYYYLNGLNCRYVGDESKKFYNVDVDRRHFLRRRHPRRPPHLQEMHHGLVERKDQVSMLENFFRT
jgi:hypothetical protein